MPAESVAYNSVKSAFGAEAVEIAKARSIISNIRFHEAKAGAQCQHHLLQVADKEQNSSSVGFIRRNKEQNGSGIGFIRQDKEQNGSNIGFMRQNKEQNGSSIGFIIAE